MGYINDVACDDNKKAFRAIVISYFENSRVNTIHEAKQLITNQRFVNKHGHRIKALHVKKIKSFSKLHALPQHQESLIPTYSSHLYNENRLAEHQVQYVRFLEATAQKKLSFRICPKCPELPRCAQKCPEMSKMPRITKELPRNAQNA